MVSARTMSKRCRDANLRYQEFAMATAVAERKRRKSLPKPMPGRTADGRRVWLHFDSMTWERHP